MNAPTPLQVRPDAVVFDMDGLMLDSERAIIDAFRRAAAEQGVAIAHDWWLGTIGQGDAACRALLAAHVGAVAADAVLERGRALYDERAGRGIPHRPGIVALLDLLVRHRVPRAVATSTRRPLALRKLAASGLADHFDAICTSSDVARPKPAPDVYRLAAERLGVPPRRCLALEDSPTGLRAAHSAGMTVLLVPDLLAPDAATRALAHGVAASLGEVQAMLEPLLVQALPVA
ncbi:MAG: HAD family phosphatase [Luteimonas sp.]|nr:HAD family phosphatase [Luteimonas sp.]